MRDRTSYGNKRKLGGVEITRFGDPKCGCVCSFPNLTPLVFLLLVFLYAVVIRLILPVLVVACSFVDGPVQAVPWLYPIPLSIIVV